MSAPKVSVILPVYNVAPYIGLCIEHLQAQTLRELEFIFVDDCSTDASMAAVEAWAAEDPRVRVLRNEENLGTGPSRNRGIEVARGEYLAFVDPDDYMAPDFYELLFAAATSNGGHDIAKGLRVDVDASGAKNYELGFKLNRNISSSIGKEPLYLWFKGDHWAAIYSKRLFSNADVRYGTSRKSQDTTFQLRVGLITNDIVLQPKAEFYHVTRGDSSTARQDFWRFEQELDGLREKIATLRARGLDDDACRYIANCLSHHLNSYRSAARYGSPLHEHYARFLSELLGTVDGLPKKKRVLSNVDYIVRLSKRIDLTALPSSGPSEERVRVSVILPVYNPGDYIHACIDSLRQQLLGGLEFIFVDDCSTDASMAAVEAWAAEDPRVRILRNEENLGTGPSRNRGIEVARGEYLAFVDPDDSISPYFYELLYAAATAGGGHDIAKGQKRRVSPSGVVIEGPSNKLNDSIRKCLSESRPLWLGFTYNQWTAIYKRELFSGGDVFFGSSRVGQDIYFLLRVCYKTNDIVFEDHAFYNYVPREGSATGRNTAAPYIEGTQNTRECILFLREKGFDENAYRYAKRITLAPVNRFQEAMGKNPSLRKDFDALADKLCDIPSIVPNPEKLYENNPRLKLLLNGRPLTTPGLRAPGEGEVRVSVIVPVYNVEGYIDRCVESLCKQLLDGLEFIFIDDCSTDASMEPVEAWAAQDDRVRIIKNEKNMGAGYSRNLGIEAARGGYLSFIDPDDYVSPNFHEMLYAAATTEGKHDIAKGRNRKVSSSGETLQAPSNAHNNWIANELRKGTPIYRTFHYSHCTAIYRRELFEDGLVRYGASPNGEDLVFLLKCCYRTNDIVFTQHAEYNYVIDREDSADHAEPTTALFNNLDTLEEQVEFFCAHEDFDDNALLYLRTMANGFITSYCLYMKDDKTLDRLLPKYSRRFEEIVRKLPPESVERFLAYTPVASALVKHSLLVPAFTAVPKQMRFYDMLPWLKLVRLDPSKENVEACFDTMARYGKKTVKDALKRVKSLITGSVR